MTYTILYEKIAEENFPEGYFYAHIPSLDITTHGLGIEGAKASAMDLINIWVEEKKLHGEKLPIEQETFVSKIEVI